MIELRYQEIYDAFYEISGGDNPAAQRTYAIDMTRAFLDQIYETRKLKGISDIQNSKLFKEIV